MPSNLESRPIEASEITLYNHQYLHGCTHTADPTMVWGTEVEAEGLQSFIIKKNKESDTLVSPAHVLVQAVGRSLARFPKLNCRVVRGRIYRFRQVSVRMLSYDRSDSDVDIFTIKNVDQSALEEIAKTIWKYQCEVASGVYPDRVDRKLLRRVPVMFRRYAIRSFWWLDRNFRLPRLGRLDRHLDSAVVVNHLGFTGAPPMRMYKPSRFPDESSLLSVTMGRIEQMPVAAGERVVVRSVAPLFVRADHRVTDAHLLARFVSTLRDFLASPQTMELPHDGGEEHQREAA